MPFISYAQNFEDVVLRRVLKDVEKGTYVDVGAADPVEDSVTKQFYDNGWRGINVEPTDYFHKRLVEQRIEDINLKYAISEEPGEIVLYEIPGTGLTTAIKQLSEQHRLEGKHSVKKIVVPSKTLNQVLDKYQLKEIHFLKIDVEGAEESVLKSISLEKTRPWIVVVESMEPNSQVNVHERWEYILLNSGYDFVYCDGLNRFYLAREHSELSSSFEFPPNVFDDFISRAEADLRTELSDTLTKCQREIELRDKQLERIYKSFSWKITMPFRKFKKAILGEKEN